MFGWFKRKKKPVQASRPIVPPREKYQQDFNSPLHYASEASPVSYDDDDDGLDLVETLTEMASYKNTPYAPAAVDTDSCKVSSGSSYRYEQPDPEPYIVPPAPQVSHDYSPSPSYESYSSYDSGSSDSGSDGGGGCD